jgi:serine/threonine protein kinase
LNEQHCYRVARILHSLGSSLRQLNNYYLGLKLEPVGGPELHPRYFPSIYAYRDASEVIVDYKYVTPLERDATCVTFLAETLVTPVKSIVVKFVERYNDAAHKLLEDADAAPRLLYCGKVGVRVGDPTYGHLKMVVMEYLDGKTADQVRELHQLPPTFLEEVRGILNRLHDNGFVFGDLRGANIMITNNGKVKFVDFDWAGNENVSRYPLFLSRQIQWPEGVEGLAVMKKSHDLDMLNMLV